jgi:hypothetical protein
VVRVSADAVGRPCSEVCQHAAKPSCQHVCAMGRRGPHQSRHCAVTKRRNGLCWVDIRGWLERDARRERRCSRHGRHGATPPLAWHPSLPSKVKKCPLFALDLFDQPTNNASSFSPTPYTNRLHTLPAILFQSHSLQYRSSRQAACLFIELHKAIMLNTECTRDTHTVQKITPLFMMIKGFEANGYFCQMLFVHHTEHAATSYHC